MTKILIIILVLIVIGGGAYFILNKNNTANTVPSSTPSSTLTPTEFPISGDTNSPKTTQKPQSSISPTPTKSASIPVPSPVTHNVTIQGFAYIQQSLIVKKGDTVVWTNKDSTAHTVTGKNGGPSSPTLNTDATYSYTFRDAGTFSYYCAFHPSMTGTVIVTQ